MQFHFQTALTLYKIWKRAHNRERHIALACCVVCRSRFSSRATYIFCYVSRLLYAASSRARRSVWGGLACGAVAFLCDKLFRFHSRQIGRTMCLYCYFAHDMRSLRVSGSFGRIVPQCGGEVPVLVVYLRRGTSVGGHCVDHMRGEVCVWSDHHHTRYWFHTHGFGASD